jgi:hypothetical protein
LTHDVFHFFFWLLGSTATVAFSEGQNKPYPHANCENPFERGRFQLQLAFSPVSLDLPFFLSVIHAGI